MATETVRTVALVTTGSFNPVTRAHVQMLIEAKKYMDSLTDYQGRSFKVLKGFISPSHDLYVKSKCMSLKAAFVPAKERVEMCRLAVADLCPDGWLEVSTFESEQPHFVDFDEIVLHIRKNVDTDLVVYVCGMDHFEKCCLHNGMDADVPGIGVAVLPRSGCMPVLTNLSKLVFGIPNSAVTAEIAEVSSTTVRKLLQEGSDTSHLLTPSCVKFLRRGVGATLYKQPRRSVYISLSALLHRYASIPKDELEKSLFFFGSKRFWLFPEGNADAEAESRQQPTDYLGIPEELRALILAKEARGEVCFLKPDELGEPDLQVVGDYKKASAWLEGLGYNPLKLDPSEWSPAESSVVRNFQRGYHDYGSVMTLLERSNPNLKGVC